MTLEVPVSEDESAAVGQDERAGKYLIFLVGVEEYGVRVLKVREIIGIQEFTAVPQMPDHIRGVINLRGKVIPVVDLRMRLGMETEVTPRTCIIVVQADGAGGGALMGAVVDGVAEVMNLAAADIEETPDFGQDSVANYVLGMAKSGDKVRILLDIDCLLGGHETRPIEEAVK